MSSAAASEYGVSPALTARLLGVALGVVGLVVLVATAIVIATSAAALIVALTAMAGVLLMSIAAWWLTRRAVVIRLDDQGYRIRYVRGAGEVSSRWADVVDAALTPVAQTSCLVIRLRNGRTTTLPLEVIRHPRKLWADCEERLARAGRAG